MVQRRNESETLWAQMSRESRGWQGGGTEYRKESPKTSRFRKNLKGNAAGAFHLSQNGLSQNGYGRTLWG